ncbi:MAG TPA: SPFH domain-containing protein, partial [Acidimicrobiales bacterium]|nr:SPFH domain-containing protein [Acidimicrobiales bacterium]
FRIVTGHGAYVMPFRNQVSFLTLAMQEAEVAEPCVTQQGITVQVRAVIAFKVGDDQSSIANAARRFLDDQSSMPQLVGRVFAGHLRSIVGSMTVEDIIRERQKLASEVLDASAPEMAKLGLVVDSFQIESISDDSGYITALSQPHVATVNQNAHIAQAEANQKAAEAQQRSARAQAQYAQETAVATAQYQAETDKAQQLAAQAGPLAQAQATQQVLVEQTKVAEARATLRAQELRGEVVAPAEAEAARVRVSAQAQAEAIRLQAEATAVSNGIVLERMLVEKMPEIIAAAASQLSNANITVLEGASGMGELVAGLASQGGAILAALRHSLADTQGPPPSPTGNGAAPVPFNQA